MSPDSVLHMLHRVLKRAGLPKVRFHDLRHTFATLALKSGVDVKTVSSMLGHYSAGFTLNTYTHATAQMKQDAADAIGGKKIQGRTGKILSGPVRCFPALSRLGPWVGVWVRKNSEQVIERKSAEKVLIS